MLSGMLLGAPFRRCCRRPSRYNVSIFRAWRAIPGLQRPASDVKGTRRSHPRHWRACTAGHQTLLNQSARLLDEWRSWK